MQTLFPLLSHAITFPSIQQVYWDKSEIFLMFSAPSREKSNCKERPAQSVQAWVAAYWVQIKSQESYLAMKY